MKGKIIKGIAGFYYVDVQGMGVYECHARGKFRNDKVKPLVGDDVQIEITDEECREGSIIKILPRMNELVRPAVANISQALLIFAVVSPNPNFNLLDRMIIMMKSKGLDCVICFNKKDMADEAQLEELRNVYAESGCRLIFASALENDGIDAIKEVLLGKTTAVAGPSGVGKSSIINCLQSNVMMETGEISRKLERGKHTTRHSELIAVSENTYIMDTPGFSSLSLPVATDFTLKKEDLSEFYPEFAPYEAECHFSPCAHMHEPVCGVKAAVEKGLISKVRYENYVDFYSELNENSRNGGNGRNGG